MLLAGQVFALALLWLKGAVAGNAWEGDGVADVLDAGDELDEALEAKAKAAVRNGAIFAEVEIPLVGLKIEVVFFELCLKAVMQLFSFRAADDFADFGD